jgi:hypothetical protein
MLIRNPNTASNIKSVTKIRPTILSQRMPALDGFDETTSLIKLTSEPEWLRKIHSSGLMMICQR